MQTTYFPLAICGPSGAGKGTLINWLLTKYPQLFELSVSLTTRAPRHTEQNGRQYHFVTIEDFKKEIDKDAFVEFCEVHGNYYGTHKQYLQDIINRKRICLLDIDVQGAIKINNIIKANYIWIDIPSLQVLEARLRGRGTDSEELIKKRIKNAQGQIDKANTCTFFQHVLNENIDETKQKVLQMLKFWYPQAPL